MTRLFLACIAVAILSGCVATSDGVYAGRVPTPQQPLSEQRLLPSASHWNMHASAVADEMKRALGDALLTTSVAAGDCETGRTRFGAAFRDLLNSELVRRGVGVSQDGSADSKTAFWIKMAPSVNGYQNEVVVTVAVSERDQEIYRNSTVFRIAGNERSTYEDPRACRTPLRVVGE